MIVLLLGVWSLFVLPAPPGPAHHLSIGEKIIREAGPREAPLALEIAFRESRFDAKAVNRETHDFGVFQIHSTTAIALHLFDPFNEDLNIVAGVGILRVGWEIYGSAAGARCFFSHPSTCGHLKRRSRPGLEVQAFLQETLGGSPGG